MNHLLAIVPEQYSQIKAWNFKNLIACFIENMIDQQTKPFLKKCQNINSHFYRILNGYLIKLIWIAYLSYLNHA